MSFDTAPAPARRLAGRWVVMVIGYTVSVVVCWANGLFAKELAQMEFLGGQTNRGDYLEATGATATTAALLFLALLVMLVLRMPGWLLSLTAAGVGIQLALAFTSYAQVDDAVDEFSTGATVWPGVKFAILLPGSWPLLLMLVVSAVVVARRGRPARAS